MAKPSGIKTLPETSLTWRLTRQIPIQSMSQLALVGTSLTANGSSDNATKQAGEPNHAGAAGGAPVWWNWTAPGSGTVTISTIGSNFDTLLAAYTGSSVANLTEVASNDDIDAGNRQSRVSFAAVAGTTYRIAVDGLNAASGNIELALSQSVAAPTNDNLANAATVNGSSVTVSGSNVGASKEAGEPNHANSPGGHSVWWSWTASGSGNVTISTAGSNFDTVLGVYTGPSVTGLTRIGSNDNHGGVLQSQVRFDAVTGTTYHIAVDGSGGRTGNISLSVNAMLSQPPANDNFVDAAELTGTSATTTGTNVGATKEASEPDHASDAGGRSVWWTWTAPGAGRVTMSTSGSTFNTTLAVYTGSAIQALTEVASNDDVLPSGGRPRPWSQLSFDAAAGTVYRIAVDGFGGSSGSITLQLTETLTVAPANDNLDDATDLIGNVVATTGSNVSATKEVGEPNHAGGAGGRSVWWSWRAPASGDVTVSTSNSNFDTLLAVYIGSTIMGLTHVASNDDFGGRAQSQVSFTAADGALYQIAVDGAGGASGNVALSVDQTVQRPANDDFVAASTLSGNRTVASGHNVAATKQAGEPNHAGDAGGKSLWWSWAAPASGHVRISTAASSFDTLLAVYTGSSVAALTEVASNDDFSGAQSQVDFVASAGTTYRIAVDGHGGAFGTIGLQLTQSMPAAANDNFANASVLSGTSTTGTGSNEDATKEPGEPLHAGNFGGKSLWWSWTAPMSGTTTLSTLGSNFDTILAVYTGSAVAALTNVASNDDVSGGVQSQLVFSAETGTTYHIAVDGFDGEFGNIELALSHTAVTTPENDDFAGATVLTGASVTAAGSNVGATSQPGEPNHAGELGGKSVWWRWTAPSSGIVDVSTSGSGFDTLLAIYTGSSVAALVEVVSNDDADGLESQASFFAVAGTTYRIAVDGYDGDFGIVELALSQTEFSRPPNDDFVNAIGLSGSQVTTTGSNVGATSELGEPFHAGELGGQTVWWWWTAPSTGNVTISTLGSDFDTLLAVYTGPWVSLLTEVTSNDDFADVESQVSFTAFAGITFWIAVDGYFGDSGSIELTLSHTAVVGPSNDNLADAIPLFGSSVMTTGSNVGATKEFGEPDHAGNPGGRSVWWGWTASDFSVVTISTDGSTFDTTLGVYTFFLGTLTEVASNDDFVDFESQVVFLPVAGTTHWIAVDGYDGDSGDIALAITETAITFPGNDDFADAFALDSGTVTTTAFNVFATKEAGEPDHAGDVGGSSVWWTWAASTTGNVIVSTRGSTFDTTLAVYTGSSVAALTEVASNDDIDVDLGIGQSELAFDAVAGTTYRIAVDGFNGDAGGIALTIIPEALPPTVAGDANQDGRVDVRDLNILGLHWRQANRTWEQGDFTGDGVVNAADLNVLALNWQSGVAAPTMAPAPQNPIDQPEVAQTGGNHRAVDEYFAREVL
jgi:hypothetical protein